MTEEKQSDKMIMFLFPIPLIFYICALFCLFNFYYIALIVVETLGGN